MKLENIVLKQIEVSSFDKKDLTLLNELSKTIEAMNDALDKERVFS